MRESYLHRHHVSLTYYSLYSLYSLYYLLYCWFGLSRWFEKKKKQSENKFWPAFFPPVWLIFTFPSISSHKVILLDHSQSPASIINIIPLLKISIITFPKSWKFYVVQCIHLLRHGLQVWWLNSNFNDNYS